ARRGGGDLDREVGAVVPLHPRPGLGHSGVGVVGEGGGHLHRDETVPPVGLLVHVTEGVAGPLDVAAHQGGDDLLGGGTAAGQLGHLSVVVLATHDRLGEDGGVGGHASHGVAFDPLLQFATVQHPA